MSRRGIHTLDDLQARCEVYGPHWIWQGMVVRGRASANLQGHVVHGARITALVLGRDSERQPHQRWTVRCGERLCLSPNCLLLARSHAAAHQIASRAGRLKRDAAASTAISRAHVQRGTAYPAWMVAWAMESTQPSREVGRTLGVHDSTVRAWRNGTRHLQVAAGPFSQLLIRGTR